MSPQGEHVGGIAGFVKTLRRLVDDIAPKSVYIVWEGGGSSRRRSLYSAYKAQRKPGKLNRFYEDDIPDTDENKLRQVSLLIKVLRSLPVCQLYVSDVEADDVIAYLVTRTFSDENKVIVSTDKDMYQLLNDRTHIYDMNKKEFVTPEKIMETYHVPPRNFALAKVLCGDGSDNIPGVKGVGYKTAAKKFPLLQQTDTDVLLSEIIDYASTRVNQSPVYKNVVASSEQLKTNWRLVYLDGSMLSFDAATKLDNVIESYIPKLDKMGFIRSAIEAGVNTHLDIDGTVYTLKSLYENAEKR